MHARETKSVSNLLGKIQREETKMGDIGINGRIILK
jgi:hypothetical protein